MPGKLAESGALHASLPGSSITIYRASWCPECKAAEEHPESMGASYRYFDVEHSYQGSLESNQYMGAAIPLIVIKGGRICGFDSGWIDQQLR